MTQVEIYGIGYQSPAILYYLVSPKKYYPILLVTPTQSQIKHDVQNQQKLNSSNKTPVVFAGSIEIAKLFVKLFPKLKCKLILCEYPSFLLPFKGPEIRWLDCDHQPGGAWQITKVKPEDFNDLLDTLGDLSDAGRKYLESVVRNAPKDRTNEIEAFSDNIPKTYKDLIASVNESDKSPLKAMKESRKTKDSLKTLLLDALTSVESKDQRSKLVHLVYSYLLTLTTKREFLNKLQLISKLDQVKKDFLTVRKWIDSKAGQALHDAYFDFSFNKSRRSWKSILETHKKVHEEDLILAVSFLKIEGESLQKFSDKLESFAKYSSDKQVPKEPFNPKLLEFGEVFNYG